MNLEPLVLLFTLCLPRPRAISLIPRRQSRLPLILPSGGSAAICATIRDWTIALILDVWETF